MGSFKGQRRDQDSKRRDKARGRRRLPTLDALENRRLLTGGGSLSSPPTWHPTDGNLADAQNGPMANAGVDLINIYQGYIHQTPGTAYNPPQANTIFFQGNSVGIAIRGYGDETTYLTALKNLGMKVEVAITQANDIYVTGYLPVSALPSASAQVQTIGLQPLYKPQTRYIGQANNEAETALKANIARQTYGVDGTGQTVGVISDSVNQFQETNLPGSPTGVAASVATGDIPNAGDVNILSDGPAGSSDEGRAMIEGIFDIAPGVKTAFSAAGDSDAAMAASIINLVSQAHSNIVVDDIGFFDEPFFQDGIISQAIQTVASQGITYFAAAGNEGDSGYLSDFRSVSANVPGVGQGTYLNYNPNGGTLTNLSFTVTGSSATTPAIILLQWDNPFYTTNGVTTSLSDYVLDSGNNVVYSGTTNAVATQQPEQRIDITADGTYTFVVQVAQGPVPNKVEFIGTGEAVTTFTKPFGNAGGVAFPTSVGHSATNNMIGTGAVPFWGTPAYLPNLGTYVNEPYSSNGPALQIFNADGTRKATPQTILQPFVSGTDAGNTSFFIPGEFIDTSNPGIPGDPATATNQSQPNFPNFTGTSFAAPSLAAVAALMKQLNPSATPPQIAAAMKASALPLNGTAAGVWDSRGGYGLVDATKALNVISNLQISSISPGGGSTVSVAPGVITVTFNKPIEFSTLNPYAFSVSGPPGVNVQLGAAVAVDDPNFPTVIQYPFTFTRAPGTSGNGRFTDSFVAGGANSRDGKANIGFSDSFVIDQTAAPKVTGTSVNGRIIKVTFSEPLDPSTVNSQNVFLMRANNPQGLFNAGSPVVNRDPRATTTYDPTTKTVTIDLSGLPQSLLPTDTYQLVVQSPSNDGGPNYSQGITDIVGNNLDGEFSGAFPSGDGISGGTFYQSFGRVSITAPSFNTVKLAPGSDSGIANDQNTNVTQPTFTGQVGATFPGTAAGLTVIAEFNGLSHNNSSGQPEAPGTLDLASGIGGRGFVGNYDVITTTNASGQFTLKAPANLPDGFNTVRFLVIGQPDSPPLPGYSTSLDLTFRVSTTHPLTDNSGTHPSGASIPNNAQISTLGSLSLYFTSPVQPTALGSPFAVPTQFSVPALDPATASNTSNYSLFLKTTNASGATVYTDESSFIKTATYVDTSNRVLTRDPFTGRVDLTFSTGMPSGNYVFVARTTEPGFTGIRDAAGNPLAGNPGAPNNAGDYYLNFTFQSQAAYITNYQASSPDGSVSGPRAYYEVPAPGATPRASAPPTQFTFDFSNSLKTGVDYSNDLQLIASGLANNGEPSGNFGTLGITDDGTGYTRVNPSGTSVTLENSVAGAVAGQPGFMNRLVLTLPAGYQLAPQYYRLFVPNSGANTIIDRFGNQLDGEFLGNPTANGSYTDLMPNGQTRQGLSGDGVAGGAFITGFVVVPNGNIIYAKPDAPYNPYAPAGQQPDGSLARPYPTLAPQATPTALNGGNLNSPINFGTNFNTEYDRNGSGQFEPSALFAAQVQGALGPVVVVALPGTQLRDPITGLVTQQTFVLRAPRGQDPVANDGSVSIPTLTTLVFAPGSTLKLENASLLVQNQGSALQVLGGPNPSQGVTFTSYADSSVGAGTVDGSNNTPRSGDWGGILFRNYDEQGRSALFPGQIQVTGSPSIDGRLQGPGGADAISGSDDVMSMINYAMIKYAGGAVPQTVGFRYDAVTLQNARPAITNDTITLTGGTQGSQAAISANVDSLREDEIARGPLIRNDTFIQNSVNGIAIRAEANGVAEPTNAIAYPFNPTTLGGSRNFTLASPYAYVLTAPLIVGSVYLVETGGSETSEPDRLYVQPGMMVKAEPGAGIEILSAPVGQRQSSINVGDRTYIQEFDNNPAFGPTLANGQPNPNFKANPTTAAGAVFTSIYDNLASTFYSDPITGQTTQIVAPMDVLNSNGLYQPTTGVISPHARWGGIQLDSPAVAVITGATIENSGGFVNTPTGTEGRHALELAGAFNYGGTGQTGSGTHLYLTNNNFFNDGIFTVADGTNAPFNPQAPINITPDGLFAGDPQRPLQSGAPFIHANVFQNDGLNGVTVQGASPRTYGPNGVIVSNTINRQDATDDVNALWAGSDFTYIVQTTIAMGGSRFSQAGNTAQYTTPAVPTATLTVQATLPNTVLADGSVVAKPGIPVIIKLQGSNINGTSPTVGIGAESNQGAGFVSGIDNTVDPTADPLIDIGVASSMRFLGIPGNQTTGQTRVPVIITSIHDLTVGTTVRGITMNQPITGDTVGPAAGDGGSIVFGSHTTTSLALTDPRYGNLIDNVDAKYLSRIEQIGGGLLHLYDVTGQNSYNVMLEPNYAEKLGQPLTIGGQQNFGDQVNYPMAMTVSNSNFFNFRDYGFQAHPLGNYGPDGGGDVNAVAFAENYNQTPSPYRGPIPGEATQTFFVNDTFTGMPVAIQLVSQTEDLPQPASPTEAVILNTDFYKNGTSIRANAPGFDGKNANAHNYFLAMNDIFDGSTTAAIQVTGQDYNSQSQYSLFYNNAQDVVLDTQAAINRWVGNNFPVNANPQFLAPDASPPDFTLAPTSPAINSARSEIGPLPLGDMLFPAVNTGGVRTDQGGNQNAFGGLGFTPLSQDYVTLPGSPLLSYNSSFIAGLPGASGSLPNPNPIPGIYSYTSITGERDQAGNLFGRDFNSPNVGFGSNPYFAIGAFEYVQTFPPHVTGVTATFTGSGGSSPTTTSIYSVGGVAGTSNAPQSIQVQFDQNILPSSITSSTVELEQSGDGNFGNPNDPLNKFINLAGKLAFDPATNTLTVSLGNSGLILPTAEYRLFLIGTGNTFLEDPQGFALDGENLDGSGNQRTLPSGDGTPGGNFQVTFTVDTHPPSITPTTFHISPETDTNRPDSITDINQPSFVGTISDIFPPVNFLQGQTVHIDISTKGDGVFDLIDAGVGTTDANGNFDVKINTPLPDSPYVVGANGFLAYDYTKNPPTPATTNGGYSIARVRIVDQSGNTSDTINDPFNTFLSKGAVTSFVVDTHGARVTGLSPSPGSLATLNSGTVPVTITFNKNVDPASFNSSTLKVVRSGGDGIFGNGNDVPVAIDTSSLVFRYLGGGNQGPESVTFNVTGATANDIYQLTLVGTGTSPVIDIAGNALDGAFNGSFPSGNFGKGSDFVSTFIVYSPSLIHTIFVGSQGTDATAVQGTRENPFPTITTGLAAASTGDVVAVLPGVYTESITLKSLVTLESAALTSTDSSIVHGDPLQTIIRAPAGASTGNTGTITVTGSGLSSVNLGGVVNTEITGFTIASPLQGDPASGNIQTGSIGLLLVNSNVLVDHDYFIDSALGVSVYATGPNQPLPRIIDDGVFGNTTGIAINATGDSSIPAQAQVYNDTIAFNTFGVVVIGNANNPIAATVANTILWQNHDRTLNRAGFGVGANNPGLVQVFSDLFSGNGPSQSSPADDTYNVTVNGFNPSLLVSTGPDRTGSFTGEPAFVAPRDPRPGADGPAVFFLDANFDLTLPSAAIDRSNPGLAPAVDFLYRGRVTVPGRAFPGTGPADVGAFEYKGTGGQAIGGSAFRVASTSLSGTGASLALQAAVPASQAPTSVVVDFSAAVDKSTVVPNDLAISGSGVNPSNPVKATSLTWIDDHTVRFNLTGGYNKTGLVIVDLPENSIKDLQGRGVYQLHDAITLVPDSTPVATPTSPVVANPTASTSVQSSTVVVTNNPAPPTAPAKPLTARQIAAAKKAAQAAALKAHKAALAAAAAQKKAAQAAAAKAYRASHQKAKK